MEYHTLAILWLFVSYIIYLKVSSILLRRRNAAAAAKAGCLPPPALPLYKPLGIDRIFESLNADKAKTFPDLVIHRYAEMGNRTHSYQVLGTRGVMTCDPKNIQAVLATQFHDFETGPIRRGYLTTLLGNGIFTTDGKMWQHSRTLLR